MPPYFVVVWRWDLDKLIGYILGIFAKCDIHLSYAKVATCIDWFGLFHIFSDKEKYQIQPYPKKNYNLQQCTYLPTAQFDLIIWLYMYKHI